MKATIHWVSAAEAVPAEVRLYNLLFTAPQPDASNFAEQINPESLEVLTGCMVEPALAEGNDPAPMQFERQGYFCRDRTPRPASSCSTARWACAIPGPRSPREPSVPNPKFA